MDVSGRRTVRNACKYLGTVGVSRKDTDYTLYSVSSLWLLEQKFVVNRKLLVVKGKSEFKTV